MKTLLLKKQCLIWLFASMPIIALLTACSDDKSQQSSRTESSGNLSQAKNDAISVDTPQDPTPEAEDDQKKQFQHDFAAQCAERELNDSQNQSNEANKVNKACDCIAAYITKDLTDEEAKKFLFEKENPQSLRIKYEAAAYECLQEKVKPAEPHVIKPQS